MDWRAPAGFSKVDFSKVDFSKVLSALQRKSTTVVNFEIFVFFGSKTAPFIWQFFVAETSRYAGYISSYVSSF